MVDLLVCFSFDLLQSVTLQKWLGIDTDLAWSIIYIALLHDSLCTVHAVVCYLHCIRATPPAAVNICEWIYCTSFLTMSQSLHDFSDHKIRVINIFSKKCLIHQFEVPVIYHVSFMVWKSAVHQYGHTGLLLFLRSLFSVVVTVFGSKISQDFSAESSVGRNTKKSNFLCQGLDNDVSLFCLYLRFTHVHPCNIPQPWRSATTASSEQWVQQLQWSSPPATPRALRRGQLPRSATSPSPSSHHEDIQWASSSKSSGVQTT